MAFWSKTFAGVGRWSIAYGVFLGLFWVLMLMLLWSRGEVLHIESAEDTLGVLLFGAVPVALVVTGLRSRTAAAGSGTRAARSVTAVLLACKSCVSCYWAVMSLQDTGWLSGISHIMGVLILVCVVLPSVVWAVVLVRTAIPSDKPDEVGPGPA